MPRLLSHLFFFFLILCFDPAQAVTREEVLAGAEKLYRTRIAEYAAVYQLDADPDFLTRIRHIAAVLIRQAKMDYPLARQYDWEVHVTEARDESASCMAGGKLLVGRLYVAELELNDAELAMLLSHEIQHAVLEHNFKEYLQALRLEPERSTASYSDLEDAVDHDERLMLKLAEFNRKQEIEADLEGLRMAWRAGWPALELAAYYKKLARSDTKANFENRDHPASSQRWIAVHQLALELNKTEPGKYH